MKVPDNDYECLRQAYSEFEEEEGFINVFLAAFPDLNGRLRAADSAAKALERGDRETVDRLLESSGIEGSPGIEFIYEEAMRNPSIYSDSSVRKR